MNAPKKEKSTEARTAQTGMMTGLDYVGKQYITPKKGVPEGEDYDEENVVSVTPTTPTKDETLVASRQEKFQKALMTAKGRKHRKHRKTAKKTKKSKRRARK
jgi:tartrate dehydratase beta subunit/fumarate hydratase class I family protein